MRQYIRKITKPVHRVYTKCPHIEHAGFVALAEREAGIAELQRALVDHNDALRSAHDVAERAGATTNWSSFRDLVSRVLTAHHTISNYARKALAALRPE